jgi:amino acid adenylation domain-containing protein
LAAAQSQTLIVDTATALAAPSPAQGFREAVERHGATVALEIGSRNWTYAELASIAASISAHIIAAEAASPFVAVFASRSLSAFAGTLALFGAGAVHVAINPAHPPRRCASILEQAEVGTIIVGNEALPVLSEVLRSAASVRCVIAPESEDLASLRTQHPTLRFVPASELATGATFDAPCVKAEDLAYLVFTSGSTGAPKGIAISHGNLATYTRNFRLLAPPLQSDRVATTYELTFDIALHDMFQTWFSGGTLCVLQPRHVLAPARFIRDQRITYWFSVASAAMLMEQQGTLRRGVFPLLRVSMLCGEPLPAGTAEAWAAAAPNSVLYNVYGPTETTMELAFYRWERSSPSACRRAVVPIGIPFADHRHLLLDTTGAVVEGPGRGELLIAGPQVGRGYWKLPQLTSASFVQLPGCAGTWYRTGDLVERDEAGVYHFVSRIDHQVKLRGHRIELGEIEAALREVAETNLAVVIPYPCGAPNADGLVAFLAGGAPHDADAVRSALAARLPAAMVPDRIERLPELPLNSNRKIDRSALAARIDVGSR